MSKRTAVILAAILVLAGGLRLYHLGFQSFWIDEIASMNGSAPELPIQTILDYSAIDQPPAFLLLLHGWFKIFPFGDLSGRSVALLAGLTGIVAIFFLGKEVKDERVGLIAALITAVNYIHIFYSQETRSYTLIFLLSALSLLFFLKAIRTTLWHHFFFYSLFTTILLYTHFYGLVVLAAEGILFVLVAWRFDHSRKFILFSLVSAVAILIWFSPWIPVYFSNAQKNSFWIGPEPFYFPFRYFYLYFKDKVSALVFGGVILLFLYEAYRGWKKSGILPKTELLLTGFVVISYLIPAVYSWIRIPLLQMRYTIIVLPAIIVIIATGLSNLKISWLKIILTTTCITSLVSLIWIEKYYTTVYKEDWRGVSTRIASQVNPDDVLVSPKAWYCNYYLKSMAPSHLAINPDQLVPNLKPSGIWWIDGFDLKSEPDAIENQWLDEGYRPVRTDSLFHVRATYYRKPD